MTRTSIVFHELYSAYYTPYSIGQTILATHDHEGITAKGKSVGQNRELFNKEGKSLQITELRV